MNILNNINVPPQNEEFKTLLEHKNIKIIRIVSSDNVEPIEYIQDEDEWILLLEGKATILVESKETKLSKGDTLFIPTETKHKITYTQNATVWLAIHISSN
jgi:cupin 2 domain-containing protein